MGYEESDEEVVTNAVLSHLVEAVAAYIRERVSPRPEQLREQKQVLDELLGVLPLARDEEFQAMLFGHFLDDVCLLESMRSVILEIYRGSELAQYDERQLLAAWHWLGRVIHHTEPRLPVITLYMLSVMDRIGFHLRSNDTIGDTWRLSTANIEILVGGRRRQDW